MIGTNTSKIMHEQKCIHSKYLLREDDILEVVLTDDFFFTLKDAKEITTNIKAVSKNIPRKTLIIAGTLSTSDDEARKYASTKESTDPILALVIVTNSLSQTLIANFIMNFQKPRIPTKVFKSKKEAEQWLVSVSK